MQLDLHTLLASVMTTYFAGAVVLGLLAAALKSCPRHIRLSWALWSFALLLSGACAILIGVGAPNPHSLSITVANAFMLFGFGIRVNAISLLYSRRISHPWLPFAATFGWLALSLLPWFRDELVWRAAYNNGFCIFAMLLCIRECWRQHSAKQFSAWLLLSVFALDIAIRISGLGLLLSQDYPDLNAAFEAPLMKMLFVALLFAIVLKIVGLGIAVFEQVKGQYEDQASQDPVTGLPNRRAFATSTRAVLDRMNRSARPYALVTLEIDDLQKINARFGQSMGEAFLRLLGHICVKTVDDRCQVGRIRDNQFAVFLPEANLIVASALTKSIGRTLTVESARATTKRLAVTASIGIFYGDSGTPFERALEIADHCLSRAKAGGGNRTVANDGLEDGPLKSELVVSPFATRRQSVA